MKKRQKVEEEKCDQRPGAKESSLLSISSYDSDVCHRPKKVKNGSITLQSGTKSQVSLKWIDPPRSVLVVKKHHSKSATHRMNVMGKWLIERGITVFVERTSNAEDQTIDVSFHTYTSAQRRSIDLCICLGGDGTLLHLNSMFQEEGVAVPPTIAFSSGSLGFLTPFHFSDFQTNLAFLLQPQQIVPCTLRLRLTARVFRTGATAADVSYNILNEVLIDRGADFHISELVLSVDRQFVSNIMADGLIVSTPTGSTAYSMSAGGSMVAPTVPAILLTPICPHSLSFRPVILPDSAVIDIAIPTTARHGCWVSFDGRNSTKLNKGDRVEVRMSSAPFPSINGSAYSTEWFTSIKSKLHWNVRGQEGASGFVPSDLPPPAASPPPDSPAPSSSTKASL
mmetsp:Transcript_3806/g.5772  ORF Transcript_3806/g.5772 Transcript_3806/m.5772 type:complete len:395 (-) Transcript_3806:27-1211(-)